MDNKQSRFYVSPEEIARRKEASRIAAQAKRDLPITTDAQTAILSVLTKDNQTVFEIADRVQKTQGFTTADVIEALKTLAGEGKVSQAWLGGTHLEDRFYYRMK